MKTTKILLAFLLVLLASLVLGCETKNVEDVIKKVKEKRSNFADYSASAEVTNYITGYSYSVDLWVKGEKQRIHYTQPDEISGAIFVNNGSIAWFYNPVENMAIYAKPEDVRINFDYGAILESVLQNATTEIEKGEEDYIVKAKENGVTVEITITRDYYPTQIKWLFEGNEVMKIRYYNFSFNNGLDDSFFEYIPPENATVSSIEELKQRIVTFESIEEAEKDVGFKACKPEYLPGKFNLTISVLKPLNVLILTYSNETEIIEVKERIGKLAEIEGGENIEVGNVTAYFLDAGHARVMSWKQGGIEITITTTLERNELIKVVESFRCE